MPVSPNRSCSQQVAPTVLLDMISCERGTKETAWATPAVVALVNLDAKQKVL